MRNANSEQRIRDTARATEITGTRWCSSCAAFQSAQGGYIAKVRGRSGCVRQQWRCEGCRRKREARG